MGFFKPPFGHRRRSRGTAVIAVIAVCFLFAGRAQAGGGPENVLLLVNSKSWESRSIANHFVALRQIPASNVVSVDWDGDLNVAKVEEFRTKILQPALAAMEKRGLGGQIDYLVYSADFPWSISLRGDGKATGIPPGREMMFYPTASLTGTTFLWQYAMAKTPNIIGPNSNHYCRHLDGRATPTHGFSAWYGWDAKDAARRPDSPGGRHYYLSTMLGVTTNRGNTLGEVFSYLSRSAAADGTRPRGTIYYAKSQDAARSGPRHGLYPEAVRKLDNLGVRGQVVEGNMPENKSDVLGAMMGVSRFDWSKSGSKISPGAICDNLTSFGGIMNHKAGKQTTLAEFLKYGAAGASGTVVEPTNVPLKFPHPDIHAHYAAGCTLAEAFYQSIAWPYQVLIVGDPLCRPWARIPMVRVTGVKGDERIRGTVTIKPGSGSTSVARFELFVDGLRRDKCDVGGAFQLDTKTLADGYHELRIVAVESRPIETQGRVVLGVIVNNLGKSVRFTAGAEKKIRRDRSVELTLDAPGAARIVVMHQDREVGRVNAAFGKISISGEKLGLGRVVLHAEARTGEEERERVLAIARPVEIEVIEKP